MKKSSWGPGDDALAGTPKNERCRERGRRAVNDGAGRVPGVGEARHAEQAHPLRSCRAVRKPGGRIILPSPLPPSKV